MIYRPMIPVSPMRMAMRRMAARMGERRVMGRFVIYDLLSPFYSMAVRIARLRKDPTVWR